MSIGIYDADVATYGLVPFNLECMKISSYYKRRREVVVMAPEFTPERHQKFFFRKDYEDGNYPSGLTQPNINYGGLAFTNNIYRPLPMEVEHARPDTQLYEKWETAYRQRGVKGTEIFRQLTKAEHLRLSLDGATVWKDYEAQLKNLSKARIIFFHDFNLGAVQDGYDVVCDLLAKGRVGNRPTAVGTKFPIQVSSGDAFCKWARLPPSTNFYSLRFNGIIPDDAFTQWIGDQHGRVDFTAFEYDITTGSFDENQLIKEGLPKILEQVILSCSHWLFFLLIYRKDFFKDSRWCRVIDLFNYYMASARHLRYASFCQKIPAKTIYEFIQSFPRAPTTKAYQANWMTLAEARQLLAFVADENPILYDKIINCSAKQLGGNF